MSYELASPGESRITGIPGFAIRIGRALEAWGHRRSRPLAREQLQQLESIRNEARQAIQQRSDVHLGVYHLHR